MEEVFRTNDLVKLSYIRHLLSEEGIEPFVLDEHTAMIDGRGPMIPIRIGLLRSAFATVDERPTIPAATPAAF